MSVENTKILLPGIERDFKLGMRIMYTTLSLGLANVLAIFLFEELIVSHATSFQYFSDIPAIKHATQLLCS